MTLRLPPEISNALLKRNLEWLAERCRREHEAACSLEDAGLFPYGSMTGRIGPSIKKPEDVSVRFVW